MAVTAGVPGGVADDRPRATSQRSRWRSVAIPSEHGGWGLTAEPALLGLLVAPSIAGGVLAVAAVVAFLARTPLKLVLVDRWRRRRLPQDPAGFSGAGGRDRGVGRVRTGRFVDQRAPRSGGRCSLPSRW